MNENPGSGHVPAPREGVERRAFAACREHVDLLAPIREWMRRHGNMTISGLASDMRGISHGTLWCVLSPNSPRKGGSASTLAPIYAHCGIRLFWTGTDQEVLVGAAIEDALYFRAAIGAGLIRARMTLNALSDHSGITVVGAAQIRRYLPSMAPVTPETGARGPDAIGPDTVQRIIKLIATTDKRLCEPAVRALEQIYAILGIEPRLTG